MFPVQDMDEQIRRSKNGDHAAREDFLGNCKPFVYRVASKFSGKFLEWGRDEELAVALIAFNEALDRYREETGVPFLAYARMVMKSRLTDYRRRESRNAIAGMPLPLDDDNSNGAVFTKSWEAYWEDAAHREREEEIKEFEALLNKYGVSFEDLVRCSPKHRDTRHSLMQAAVALAESNSLFQELRNKKKMPLTELERVTGVSRKSLERGRKYIIAVALLISRREDFLFLSSYLKLPAPGL